MNAILQNNTLGPLLIILLAWLPTIVFLLSRATMQENAESETNDSNIGRKSFLFYIRLLCAVSAFAISILLFQKWSISAGDMNKIVLFLNSLLQGTCAWFFIKWAEPQFARSADFYKTTTLPILGDFSVSSDASKLDQLKERFLTCLNSDKDKIIIGISEPMEGCGKSALAAALAKSFSRTNKNVLLIEADLWQSTPNWYIPHSERNKISGFSELMQGEVTFEKALYYPANESFTILPRGQLKEKATKVLSSDLTEIILECSLAKFDRIIIDCPNFDRYKDLNKLISKEGFMLFCISNQIRNKRTFNLIQGIKKGGLLDRSAFVFTHTL